MVILMVVLTLVIIVVVDLGLRFSLRRIDEAKTRKERQRALDLGLRLEFAAEARSLKRVELPSPKARILAVDDEPVSVADQAPNTTPHRSPRPSGWRDSSPAIASCSSGIPRGRSISCSSWPTFPSSVSRSCLW